MGKYKVGDKVKIRCDLEKQAYGENYAVSGMVDLRGKVATITKIIDGFKGVQYNIDIDAEYWCWTEEMFCDVGHDEAFTKKDLKDGMFGYTDKDDKFMVYNGYLVYQDGDFNRVCDIKDNLTLPQGDKIMAVYDNMNCFNNLKPTQRIWYHAVYERDIPKLTLEEVKSKIGYDFELVEE